MKKKISTLIIKILVRIISSKYIKSLNYRLKNQKAQVVKKRFKKIGRNAVIPESLILKNPQFVSIGSSFSALGNLRIEAITEYHGKRFNPEIIIGNNVCMNYDIHIGCINKISIGDGVLMASRIFITDHAHGDFSEASLKLSPLDRKLISKGPVSIGNNVWIGEGVCILAGVNIGDNVIIGANAVVTKNFPANCVIGGVPAGMIKHL